LDSGLGGRRSGRLRLALARGPPDAFRELRPSNARRAQKCTWPSWPELKGSTVVIFISIIILGGFTMLVDRVLVSVFLYLHL